MNIFPYTLLRIGGAPIDELSALNLSEQVMQPFEENYTKLLNATARLKTLSEAKIEEVDPVSRRSLRKLLSDLEIEKTITPKVYKPLLPYLSEQEQECVHLYNELLEQQQSLELSLSKTIDQEMGEVRAQFTELINEEDLKKGLLLSSNDLLNRLEQYTQKSGGKLSKNDLKAELGLIKYISRMRAKTSPFSTFTNLGIARMAEQGPLLSFDGAQSPQRHSHVRLNNLLLRYLKNLLSPNPNIYPLLKVRINPTVRIEDEEQQIIFLTNNNNTEAFQRLEGSAVLELIKELTESESSGIVYSQLLEKLQEYISAGADQLNAYLQELISFGFLEYNFGVSGLDPNWDSALIHTLRPLADQKPVLKELLEVLILLREQATAYEQGNTAERKAILKQVFGAFKAICMLLHEDAGLPEHERKSKEELAASLNNKEGVQKKEEPKTADPAQKQFKHRAPTYFYFTPEQIYFEDTTLTAETRLNSNAFSPLVEKLNRAFQQLRLFRYLQEEENNLYAFFTEKYGEEQEVSLFGFYESYYREYKLAEEKKLDFLNKNPDLSQEERSKYQLKKWPLNIRLNQLQAEWREHYKHLIREKVNASGQPVALELPAIEEVNQKLKLEDLEGSASYGAFMQLYQEEESGNKQLKAVINNAFPGYGKMMSRFMHILNDEVVEEVRRYNLAYEAEDLLIENCDASYFNANLHPPLMPLEIWMPGSHNTLPEDRQIPITALHVRVNKQEKSLELIHRPSGKRCYVFDLGFQGSKGRSPLYKMLTSLSRAEFLSASVLVSVVNELADEQQKESSIKVYPRVELENQLIIQRKSWVVPHEHLPNLPEGKEVGKDLLDVQKWRRKLGLPEEVFVFVNPREKEKQAQTPKNKVRVTRDDYKPQYIHFGNPLLIRLFKKLLTKVPYSLKISEMLPSSSQLNQMNGKSYVTEFVAQWYCGKAFETDIEKEKHQLSEQP